MNRVKCKTDSDWPECDFTDSDWPECDFTDSDWSESEEDILETEKSKVERG
jgi:hypothetical protein